MTEHRWTPHFEPPAESAGDPEGAPATPRGTVAVTGRPAGTRPQWEVPPAGGWADGSGGPGLPPTWSPPPPPPASPRRPGWGAGGLAVGIIIALVLGFLGGGLVLRTGVPDRGGLDVARPGVPATTPSPSPPARDKPPAAPLDLEAISAKVDPAVVDITTTLGFNGRAAGTGMVLTPTGEVLTNNHVIDGATAIVAQLNGSGPTYRARVLGTDPTHDVALLQLQGASALPTVSIGDSSTVAVGDRVAAIGNALGLGGTPAVSEGEVVALDQSVTAGDPSAGTAENLTGMIQVSAELKPGDSGGPLVDRTGSVIGMDTAASVSRGRWSGAPVGFAIPIARAMGIAEEIRAGRASATVQIGQPGFLGVQITSVAAAQAAGVLGGSPYRPPVDAGAVIAGTVSGGPAARAGLSAGDVIVGIDGTTVDSPSALTAVLHGRHPGERVQLAWVDGAGARHTSSIRLATAPTG